MTYSKGLLRIALVFMGAFALGCGASPNLAPSGGIDDRGQDSSEESFEVCLVDQARASLEQCLPGRGESAYRAFETSFRNWAHGESVFYAGILDVSHWRKRNHVSESQVKCLKEKMCKDFKK